MVFSDQPGGGSGTSTYTPAAGTAYPLSIVTSGNKQAINDSIDSLGSLGGTNISAGIDQAIDELNGALPGNKKYIILLSDGYSQNPAKDIEAADRAKAKNITIYTIGMGMPDDATLEAIASPSSDSSGTLYTKVTSLEQLVNRYSAIANNMTDVAGSDISLHLFTGYSAQYGPDTAYVPDSARIVLPNGTVWTSATSPSSEPTAYDSVTHSIAWTNLGSLEYDQNLVITYQLKLLRPGNVTPITNLSYVEFTLGNGYTNNSSINAPPIPPVGGSLKPLGNESSTLKIRITSPADGDVISYLKTPIKWSVTFQNNFTNRSFYQVVEYEDENNATFSLTSNPPPDSRYARVGNPLLAESAYSEEMSWNMADVPNGNYVVWVSADDGYGNRVADQVHIRIDHTPGSIVLR